MAVSKGIGKSRKKALARWFPSISEAATASHVETLEILTDLDQVTAMFSSFEDVRQGRIVNMKSAFGDL